MTTPKLALRPKETARTLGISERLLWSKTNSGEIPHFRIGRCVLYSVVEIQRWINEQTKGGDAR